MKLKNKVWIKNLIKKDFESWWKTESKKTNSKTFEFEIGSRVEGIFVLLTLCAFVLVLIYLIKRY